MIGDDNREILQLAVNRIIDSQRLKTANENIRKFKIPHIDATEYFNLIDWDNFSELL
jgi:hypothetical protein